MEDADHLVPGHAYKIVSDMSVMGGGAHILNSADDMSKTIDAWFCLGRPELEYNDVFLFEGVHPGAQYLQVSVLQSTSYPREKLPVKHQFIPISGMRYVSFECLGYLGEV